jgi:D-arabinose 1-dehydrogenase-like Zn-dependent alcohol dehydrogenase
MSDLARFQARFLEVLADATDPAAAIAELRALPDATPHLAWIDSFDPRGVETGQALVRQWGSRAWRAAGGRMRANVIEAQGRVVERELDLPAPGPGQVRIRIRAAGVCGTDVHLFHGRFRVPLPIVAGHEPAGDVDAVGEGVTGVRAGDRVGVPWMQAGCGACAECARGRAKYCRRQRNWIVNGGAFAEFMIAEAAGCVKLPDSLSFTDAAPLFCAGFTVMSGLRRAKPRPGERIAVLGLGGLGHLAIQIAAHHGHEVIAMTRARSKTRDALAFGAREVLVIREDAGRELRAIGGADVIVSTTSDVRDAGASIRGLRNEGRLVALGLGDAPMPIDPELLLDKQASVLGAMQDERKDLTDLLDLAARGIVKPRVEPYLATQLERVLIRQSEGRVWYRAVLLWP